MMLRPATPLSLLLFVAFVLLLLSVISTPIVKAIPLANYDGVDFGVFGYCKGDQCSPIRVGYTTEGLFGNGNNGNFSLSASARHSLAAILIVHPVAAFLTLICFILAATTHLHSPSHSPRYLLALLILLLPTLLVTLLAFLVDILLFVPDLKWGGWIVLAATVIEVASGILVCAMRRTLVSRKARKKRIAENPEMNGENFYSRQEPAKADSPPPLNTQPMMPMGNGAPPGGDKLPGFATFDVARERRESDEERIPLNNPSPSNRTLPSPGGMEPGMVDDGMGRYGAPGRGGPGGMRGGRGGRSYNGPRDEFGNPLPPSAAFGVRPSGDRRRDQSEPRMGNQYPGELGNMYRSRGRGRGGYPSRGAYGRGGPYGGGPGMNGNGRGIPLGPMAAGAGAGIMTGEMMDQRQQEPPPGYGNGYPPQGRGRPGQYSREQSPAPYGPPADYGRRQSPGPPSAPGYGRRPSPGPPSAPGYGRRQSPGPPSAPGYGRRQSPGSPSSPGGYGYGERGPSPGPPGMQRYRSDSLPPPVPATYLGEAPGIGQAIEMDATTGSPSQTPGWGPGTQLRDSDSDVQGLVGLQQGLQQQRGASPLRHEPLHKSPSSTYSTQLDSYVPPRAAWVGAVGRNGTPPISTQQPLGPISQSPVELPTPIHQSSSPRQSFSRHNRTNSSDVYFEDVDPRFASPDPAPQPTDTMPSALLPGPLRQVDIQQPLDFNPGGNNSPGGHSPAGHSPGGHLEPSSSYESIQEGARSPAASDASNFTSISQRGVNPNWRPVPGQDMGGYGPGMGGIPNRRPGHQSRRSRDREVLLNSNPDFEVPGARAGRSGVAGRGPMSPAQMQMQGAGMPGGGRYPGGDI